MPKFSCDYCNEDTEFTNEADIPDCCPVCNTRINKGKINIVQDSKHCLCEQYEIELVCQKTGGKIVIKTNTKIIIGRNNIGKEILNDYVSGTHCIIEYENGEYYVTDAGSTNGTFLGVSKVDCKLNPKQLLKNGELLFLGKEPFFIRHITITDNEDVNEKSIKEQNINKVRKYRCTNCGSLYIENPVNMICPNPECKSYNSFEIVLIDDNINEICIKKDK